jgi:hypothetical protein
MRKYAGVVALGVGMFVACGGSAPPNAPSLSGSPSPSGPVQNLKIVSCSPSLLVGMMMDCAVLASYSNGVGVNVADSAVWSSTSTQVVRVAPGGHVTAVGAGESELSATYQNRKDTLNISVTEAVQDSLEWTGGGEAGQLKPGNAINVSMDLMYSVVSAPTGRLGMRLFDDQRELGTKEIIVNKGSNEVSLSVTVTLPANGTKLCQTAYLIVADKTLTAPNGPNAPLCLPLSE